jgi:hypothetical protein
MKNKTHTTPDFSVLPFHSIRRGKTNEYNVVPSNRMVWEENKVGKGEEWGPQHSVNQGGQRWGIWSA